ncbi:MAG: AraC family transcriptional regulator [Oscillospiraceae bacterium]
MKAVTQEYNTRQTMLPCNYEFFYYEDRTTRKIEYHHHDFYEVYFLFSGNVTYIIDSRSYSMKPGDILLISPRQIHKPVFNEDMGTYERMVLWIDPDFIRRISTGQTNLLTCFEGAFREKKSMIRTSTSSPSLMKPLLLKLNSSMHSNEFGDDILRDVHVREVLVLLNRMYASHDMGRMEPDIEVNQIAERVTDFVEKNIDQEITLDTLSNELFVSKFHLSREFKRYTGCTIHKYIMQKRLIYARELIRRKTPITQVYLKCGFNDYSSFLRAFKSEYNMTPKQLMKTGEGEHPGNREELR